jgi:hypothetical protein
MVVLDWLAHKMLKYSMKYIEWRFHKPCAVVIGYGRNELTALIAASEVALMMPRTAPGKNETIH